MESFEIWDDILASAIRDAHEILDLCAAEEQSYNNLYYFMQTNFDTDLPF